MSYVVPFGARFAWGRAVEDSTVAYRPWRQAFRRLGIPFPLPDAGPTVSPDERSGQLLAIGEAAVSALSEASEEDAMSSRSTTFTGPTTRPFISSGSCPPRWPRWG